jgi:hypothetical protein
LRAGRTDCLQSDFDNASWEDRWKWIQQVQANNTWIGGWLNVFIGVLQYFNEGLFKDSDYMKAADAAVLWSIMRGLAGAQGFADNKPGTPAAYWRDFFKALKGGNATDSALRGMWGKAEQAGVDWSLAYAHERGYKLHGLQKDLFKEFLAIGDNYRAVVRNSRAPSKWPINEIWGIADPRNDAGKVKRAAKAEEVLVVIEWTRTHIPNAGINRGW